MLKKCNNVHKNVIPKQLAMWFIIKVGKIGLWVIILCAVIKRRRFVAINRVEFEINNADKNIKFYKQKLSLALDRDIVDLTSDEIVAISKELDQAIVDYMKRDNN